MAALTLSQLRARMRQVLSLEFTTDVSDSEEYGALSQTEGSQWINEAAKEIQGKLAVDLHDHIPTAQTPMSYTADAEEVALASALYQQIITAVFWVTVSGSTSPDDRVKLTPVSRDEMVATDYPAEGNPLVWTVQTGSSSTPSIAIRPIPDSATTLYLQYGPGWTDLTGSDTTAKFFPEWFHPWLAKWAAWRWLEEKNDPRAAVLEGPCRESYEKLKAHFLKIWPAARYRRIREPDNSRRYGG